MTNCKNCGEPSVCYPCEYCSVIVKCVPMGDLTGPVTDDELEMVKYVSDPVALLKRLRETER